jgi:hypothetical protein
MMGLGGGKIELPTLFGVEMAVCVQSAHKQRRIASAYRHRLEGGVADYRL